MEPGKGSGQPQVSAGSLAARRAPAASARTPHQRPGRPHPGLPVRVARSGQGEVPCQWSGQVRFITRPKCRTMRATMQLRPPPLRVSSYLNLATSTFEYSTRNCLTQQSQPPQYRRGPRGPAARMCRRQLTWLGEPLGQCQIQLARAIKRDRLTLRGNLKVSGRVRGSVPAAQVFAPSKKLLATAG